MIQTLSYILILWALLLAIATGIGLLVQGVFGRGATSNTSLTKAMWIGLVSTLLILKFLSFFVALGSLWHILLLFALGASGIVVAFRQGRWRSGHLGLAIGWVRVFLILIVAGLLAFLSIGSPSNFDTGLYHLGLIRHGAEAPMTFGLANLNFAFGYSSSVFDLSSFITSLPLGSSNYRFVNGFLVLLLIIDALSRGVRSRRTSHEWSGLTAYFAATAVLAYVIQFPQGLLSSPTPDVGSMILTIAVVIYLVELTEASPKSRDTTILVVGVLAVGAALVRPQNWILCIFLFPCLVWISRRECRASVTILAVLGLGGLFFVFQNIVITGWPLYPLQVLPVEGPWALPDPSVASGDIARAARESFITSFTAFGSSQSLNYFLRNGWWFLLLLIGFCFLILNVFQTTYRRSILLVSLPVVFALLVGLVVAPDPRFASGLIVGFSAANVALYTVVKGQSSWLNLAMGAMLAISLTVFLVRGIPREIVLEWNLGIDVSSATKSVQVGPLPMPNRATIISGNGSLIYPLDGSQCWDSPLPCLREFPPGPLGYSSFLGRQMWQAP